MSSAGRVNDSAAGGNGGAGVAQQPASRGSRRQRPQRRRPEATHRRRRGQAHRLQGIQGRGRPRLDGSQVGVPATGQGHELDPDSTALCSNWRSQPRTVSHGAPVTRASSTRLRRSRCRATSASTITAARSNRRSSASTGSSTWVTKQLRHRDRRGRSLTSRPWSRSVRLRAWPHGRSSPPHPGHSISPAASIHNWTDATSASTICMSVHLASMYEEVASALGRDGRWPSRRSARSTS